MKLDAIFSLPASSVPKRSPRCLGDWEPLMSRLGLALAALVPVLMVAGAMDDRAIAGVPIWVKPIRFALALSIYLLTLGFFVRFVDRAWRKRIAFRVPVFAGAAAIVMEQTIITLQAARGVDSHFNFATPLDAGLYAAMGVGSLVLTAMTLPVAWGVARSRTTVLDIGIRQAIVIGLVLTFVLTLMTAGTMAMHGGHQVGGSTGMSRSLMPIGWLRDAGDLRVPHFFATHAMHALPLVAWMVALARSGDRRSAVACAVLYAVGVGALFAQALAGRPLLVWG
ncbi:hypothetical protein ACSFA3_06845 [Variovorax sp. RHLX14]|uniref:hypothetical protein n=1 Tax=Variovorax sp. RHLX14 TaxID=1259731 RepID=UPI003F44DCF2